MTDSLFARSQLAIEESRQLQQRSSLLRARNGLEREDIRRAIFESASLRAEIGACQQDRRPPRPPSRTGGK
jgi:hypothetical protein